MALPADRKWGYALMKDIALALLTGLVLGAAFRLLRLPLPAPTALAGVAGVVGIYLGGLLIDKIVR